jgi:hypothetical protein
MAVDPKLASLLEAIDTKLTSVEKSLDDSFRAREQLNNGRILTLEKSVSSLESEAQGLRIRIQELESQLVLQVPPAMVAVGSVPQSQSVSAQIQPEQQASSWFPSQTQLRQQPSPWLVDPTSVQPVSIVPFGNQAPGCSCNKAWRMSYVQNSSWREIVDWVISEQIDDSNYLSKLVQRLSSAGLCGFTKARWRVCSDAYETQLEPFVHGPPPKEFNWLICYIKCWDYALFGCKFCKNFDVLDFDHSRKNVWNVETIEDSTLTFKVWVQQCLGLQ